MTGKRQCKRLLEPMELGSDAAEVICMATPCLRGNPIFLTMEEVLMMGGGGCAFLCHQLYSS